MPRFARPISVVGLALALIAGCASEPAEHIPTYPSLSPAESLKVLAERSRALKNISSEGLITLTRPDGTTVRLDAALVIQPPDLARLRAWKFGQAVFDMTLTPQGLWIVAPPDENRRKDILAAGGNTGALVREWLRLITGYFDSNNLSVVESGRTLVVSQARAEGMTMTCEVDRATLTPRRYALRDPRGTERFKLALSRYSQSGPLVWPLRIEAISESGRILIELHDLEVNGEIPPAAFHPPARAEKLP